MQVLENAAANVPHPEKEHMGDDGLMHCSICNTPVQTRIKFLGREAVVRCICKCREQKLLEEEEQRYREECDRRRKNCFAETNMATWTFENDDRKNTALSDLMFKYAEKFPDHLKEGTGVILLGPVGTGKTYLTACVANKLIDKGYKVLMTNFARLTNQMQGMYQGKQDFIDDLNTYHLLILDDLGAERKSEYMQETVYNIVDSRYRSGRPFIITTNLTSEELTSPKDISYERIYDRILERCVPIKVNGESRRRELLKKSATERLGLG